MKLIITPSATVSGLITAPCEVLFEIISNPERHPDIAGSGEVMEVRMLTKGPMRVGSGFQSRQCLRWYQYPTRSYVQVYEPPYRFIWLSGPGFRKPPFGQLWGFELSPVDSRLTLVSHLMSVPLYKVPNLPILNKLVELGARHEVRNMIPTLHKLAAAAHATVLGDIQVLLEWCEHNSPCGRKQFALRTMPAK